MSDELPTFQTQNGLIWRARLGLANEAEPPMRLPHLAALLRALSAKQKMALLHELPEWPWSEHAAKLESRVAELEAENERLDGRRREGRQLLARFVKYVREDRAKTDGFTRLARLTDSVADYLERTADPKDILR